MTEHISQQILYARHPEPESHYRLENPSKQTTLTIVSKLKFFPSLICKNSLLFSDPESSCDINSTIKANGTAFGSEKIIPLGHDAAL